MSKKKIEMDTDYVDYSCPYYRFNGSSILSADCGSSLTDICGDPLVKAYPLTVNDCVVLDSSCVVWTTGSGEATTWNNLSSHSIARTLTDPCEERGFVLKTNRKRVTLNFQ